MFKPENVVMYAQIVVVIALAACVIAGHDSVITDALLAVCGSVAGVGIVQKLKKPTAE